MSSNKLIQLPNFNLPNGSGATFLDSTASMESAIAALWHCRGLFQPTFQHALRNGTCLMPETVSELLGTWLKFTRSLLWLREETIYTTSRVKAIQLALAAEPGHQKLNHIQIGLKQTNAAMVDSLEDIMELLASLGTFPMTKEYQPAHWAILLQQTDTIIQQGENILHSIHSSGHWFRSILPEIQGDSAAGNETILPDPARMERLLQTIRAAERHVTKLYYVNTKSSGKRTRAFNRLTHLCIQLMSATLSSKKYKPAKPWLNRHGTKSKKRR